MLGVYTIVQVTSLNGAGIDFSHKYWNSMVPKTESLVFERGEVGTAKKKLVR